MKAKQKTIIIVFIFVLIVMLLFPITYLNIEHIVRYKYKFITTLLQNPKNYYSIHFGFYFIQITLVSAIFSMIYYLNKDWWAFIKLPNYVLLKINKNARNRRICGWVICPLSSESSRFKLWFVRFQLGSFRSRSIRKTLCVTKRISDLSSSFKEKSKLRFNSGLIFKIL